MGRDSWNEYREATFRRNENVFLFDPADTRFDHPVYFPNVSAQAAVNLSQMRPSHAWCSGFIRTERMQVTKLATAPLTSATAGTNQDSGNCTRARCKSRAEQTAKTT